MTVNHNTGPQSPTRPPIIGVMGPGEQATFRDQQLAYQLGQLIAQQGWILLTGGRPVGVMEAANRGAKQAGGTTLGILPESDASAASDSVDIVIPTGMGNARNVINVLTSHAIVACGMGSGTASEIAIALKVRKPVVLLNVSLTSTVFFQELATSEVRVAITPTVAVEQIQRLLQKSSSD
jgi:uncharacterized protein (TIGR00725 family)